MVRPKVIALGLAAVVTVGLVRLSTTHLTTTAPDAPGATVSAPVSPPSTSALGSVATAAAIDADAPAPSATTGGGVGLDAPGVDPSTGGDRGDPGHAPGAPDAGVRDVLPGAGTAPPTNPSDPGDPIGDLDDQRPVPAGFDFTAPAKQPGAPNGLGGPGGLTLAPSCSHQCITRGVAYPRGFGAEVVVETSVPAQLFITAIADLDEDGVYEDVHVESTPSAVTAHHWALDHLEPGRTYHVMAAATDEDGHTAHAWGELTTLSKRDVYVEFGSGEIVGGPGDVSGTRWSLGLDGPLTDVTPGQQGILLYRNLPRHVDVDFWVLRDWHDDLCDTWLPGGAPHGHDADACVAWNSTSLDGVDLDEVPAGANHWTHTGVARTLQSPTGAGGALPPGYGDPYYFSFAVPVTFHVTYS